MSMAELEEILACFDEVPWDFVKGSVENLMEFHLFDKETIEEQE